MSRFAAIALSLTIFIPAASADDRKFDAGLALGGHFFATDGALGADATMDHPGPADGGLIGGRLGVRLNRRIAVEGELMVIPTEDDVLGDLATVVASRAHARIDLMTGKLRPFVVAGLGVLTLRTDSDQLLNDTQAELHWGGGVRYAIGKRFDLRFDIRHLIVADRTEDGLASNVEATMGVGMRFGGKPAPAARRATVAAAPAVDTDRDGLVDTIDKCPAQAEDADKFEDADGCPDPDNDRDAIADTSDTCPLQAEIVNGWQDSDGCPDELISEIAGIKFDVHSARIAASSTAALERAYAILAENPRLRVEISGHTSIDGDDAANEQLSRWRATAVKNWLVKKGIDEARIQTIGRGSSVPVATNDHENGREQNRRIEFRVLAPTAAR